MRYVTVHKIALNDYFRLQAAGIKVNFYTPPADNKTYGVGCRLPRLPLTTQVLTPIVTKVEVSTLVPYARIKDRK